MKKLGGRPSKQHQAHHDLPWELRDEFALRGVDVNNPAFGRWVDPDTHKQWHNQANPGFNDYWKQFFADEDLLDPYTIQEILDKLAEARSQYPIN